MAGMVQQSQRHGSYTKTQASEGRKTQLQGYKHAYAWTNLTAELRHGFPVGKSKVFTARKFGNPE